MNTLGQFVPLKPVCGFYSDRKLWDAVRDGGMTEAIVEVWAQTREMGLERMFIAAKP